MTEQLASEFGDLHNQVARLTKERDRALERAEAAEANEQAANELLEEVEQGATAELRAQVTELQQQFDDLQVAIAEAERRKKSADQAAGNIQEVVKAIRATLQDLNDQKKEIECTLRELESDVKDAQRLIAEAANFTSVEQVSCGCKIVIRKGPRCLPGAMVAVITPCSSLVDDGEEPIRHVKEL